MFLNAWRNSSYLRQYAVITIVNCTAMCCGFNVVWVSPVLVKLQDANNLVLDREITDFEGAWIISSAIVGALLVTPLSPYLADNFGRKASIIIAAIPTIIGFAILTFAKNIWMVIAGRIVSTFTYTLGTNIILLYTSEIASKEIRGSLGTMLNIMMCLGFVIVLSIGPFLSYFTLNAVLFGITLVTSIPFLFLPDSPYFLYKKGQTEEALSTLTYFRDSAVQASEELKEYEEKKHNNNLSFAEIFKSKLIIKSLGIATALGMIQQVNGPAIVLHYLQTILESTKSTMPSSFASLVIGFVQLFSNVITTFVIDKYGRKPIICCGFFGVAIGMTGLGTYFTMLQDGKSIIGVMNYLPLISIIVIFFCLAVGINSVLWPLISELFEDRARATGLSIVMIFATLSSFVGNMSYVPLANLIGVVNVYWIFASLSVGAIFFIAFCVPETKCKTFAQIQAALSGEKVGKKNLSSKT